MGTFGKGAERWIIFFGVSIQPSEIIKIDHTDHFFSNEIPQLSNKIGDFFNSTLK